MAQAIAEGLIMSGTVDPTNIMASATSSSVNDWWTSRKMTFTTDNHSVISSSDVVFITVEPHKLGSHSFCSISSWASTVGDRAQGYAEGEESVCDGGQHVLHLWVIDGPSV